MEVLLCVAILSQVFLTAYVLAIHSLDQSIASSERSQASKLAQAQVEALKFRYDRSSINYWNSKFTAAGLNFCLNTSVTEPGPNWDPLPQNPTQLQVGGGYYQVDCANPSDANSAKYFINISTSTTPGADPSNPTFLITVRWMHIASSIQDVSQIYFRF